MKVWFCISISLLMTGEAMAAVPPPEDSHGAGGGSGTAENVHVSSYSPPNDIAAAEQAEIDAANPPEEGRYVDMPNLNVPVVQDGELIGYAYVLVRYLLPSNVDEYTIRDKSHFLLHELVKASHDQPFERTGRSTYDSEATRQLWLDVSGLYVDPELISGIQIIGSDIRFLNN